MNIKVNMRADIDGFDKKKSTVASGWVEIEGIFKFPVSVRSYHDEDKGKDMMFVSYPQRHDGDKYVGVVYPTDRNVRQEIDKAVLEATREKLFAELVPNVQIDDIRITPLNAKEGTVIKNVGIATVKMYGLTINGIMIREGRKGLFVQMPQYQSRGQYRDTVYGITTAIQHKIEDTVLERYQAIKKQQEQQYTQQQKIQVGSDETVVLNPQMLQEMRNMRQQEQMMRENQQISQQEAQNRERQAQQERQRQEQQRQEQQEQERQRQEQQRQEQQEQERQRQEQERQEQQKHENPDKKELWHLLNMAGAVIEEQQLEDIYATPRSKDAYLNYLEMVRSEYVKQGEKLTDSEALTRNDIQIAYLNKAISNIEQIRVSMMDEVYERQEATQQTTQPQQIYSNEEAISVMELNFAQNNKEGIRFVAKNSKLNIDNPIIVGKYIRAQSFTIENGNDKVFARFQNELNGMEHMRTGPLLIRQQIVMQVFKDGVPQQPYLYASFRADNMNDALENYNQCVYTWANLTNQRLSELMKISNVKKQEMRAPKI